MEMGVLDEREQPLLVPRGQAAGNYAGHAGG